MCFFSDESTCVLSGFVCVGVYSLCSGEAGEDNVDMMTELSIAIDIWLFFLWKLFVVHTFSCESVCGQKQHHTD